MFTLTQFHNKRNKHRVEQIREKIQYTQSPKSVTETERKKMWKKMSNWQCVSRNANHLNERERARKRSQVEPRFYIKIKFMFSANENPVHSILCVHLWEITDTKSAATERMTLFHFDAVGAAAGVR